MKKQKKRMLSVILDDWEHTESKNYNAICSANTPNWDKIIETNSVTKLKCSGSEAGLPSAQMGNSEVPIAYLGKENRLVGNGVLKDVAPTILDLLDLKKLEVMTGRSLFE